MRKSKRIAVVVASTGRPDDIGHLLEELQSQSRTPDEVVLSVTNKHDLPPKGKIRGATVLFGKKGLCSQRNNALNHIDGKFDYVVFFDDDYLPTKFSIENILHLFEQNADVVGATGHLIADGINGPGIPIEKARRLVAEYETKHRTVSSRKLKGLYGCNMAFRIESIGDLRFDEELPLYGWQEDVDFASRVGVNGRLVKTKAFAGVHRGVKRGRSSGVKLGYSQVANVIYLVRKQSLSRRYGYNLILKNIVANHARSLWPEPWVDRKGRASGNWRAIGDLLLNRVDPKKILDL